MIPFESPNQIVFDFILHKAVTVATVAVVVALLSAFNGIICAGWFRWYVSQPWLYPLTISMQRSISTHSLNDASLSLVDNFVVCCVHIASKLSLCGSKITSIKCVNSGAHAIDTIWLAEGRFYNELWNVFNISCVNAAKMKHLPLAADPNTRPLHPDNKWETLVHVP